MIKVELVQKMADGANISIKQAQSALESAIHAISEADKTQLKGFGTFEWKKRPAHTGRNPRTGEAVEIPESETLKFKASAGLRNL